MENKKTSVLLVAKIFLNKAAALGISITPLKLMKLVYIAQGVKLSVIGESLFDEKIEAWRYGPVIGELYQKIKIYGSDLIDQNALDDCCNGNILNKEDELVIDAVLQKWGDKTGPQLSTLTHQADTPWYQVWKTDGGMYTGSDEISQNLIKNHYSNLLGLD